ncbi:MAG: prolipoprotein diacylglyceryl transferase [Anaerolineae bacterium]|nr:prolipoprotein diacylglyceryl transferase [Anaerolineae bacterium]
MQPTLVVGPWTLGTYTLVRVMGVLVFVAGVFLRLRCGGALYPRGRWPVTGFDVLLAVPFLQLGLIVGAAIEVALPYLADYAVHGIPLPPGWWGGQRALGALAGGALAGYLICRARRLPAGRCFDLFAVPLPLGIAIARVGCLLQGCCYGRESTAWPALILPDVHGVWASRYPTQLASILANLVIFVVLIAIERFTPPLPSPSGGGEGVDRQSVRVRGGRRPGALFFLFVILHYGQRFVFEFWRADAPELAGPFSWTHLYTAGAVALATWMLARGYRRAPGSQERAT